MTMYKQISNVMERFDFAQVEKVMKFLDWKWASVAYQVPTVDQLKSCAYELLSSAVDGYEKQENKSIGFYASTGGFVAEVVTFAQATPRLKLSFYVESIECLKRN